MAFWKLIGACALAVVVAGAGLAWQDGATPRRTTAIRTVVAPPGRILKRDGENYYQGRYLGFASDWSVTVGKAKLRKGIDYADHLVIDPATFPAGTVMHWQWPNVAPKFGVYGYVHIAYGYYAGGVPKERVAPVQVADAGDIRAEVAVGSRTDPSTYNLLCETFLTGKPGDFPGSRGLEIGFLMNISGPGRTFFNSSEQLGRWTDPAGVAWQVAVKDKYLMLIPVGGPKFAGTLYYGAVMKWLMRNGRLTGREWFNGAALGVEPVRGDGSLRVRRWNVIGMK
jgi:hypothetical protein